MIGEIAHNEPLAVLFRQSVIEQRTTLVTTIWKRATDRGEILPGDWRLYTQMLMGPIIIRTVITAEPLDPTFCTALVEVILCAARFRD